MEELDIGSNSLGKRALGVEGIMVNSKDPTGLIQEFVALTFGGVGMASYSQSRHAVGLIIEVLRNCPKPLLLSHYQDTIAC